MIEKNFLILKDVDYYFQDGEKLRYVLQDINLKFSLGELNTIVGSSGSGKSTLLSLIGYLDKPKSGDLYIKNKNFKRIDEFEYRKNEIGIVFQNYNLITYMTGFENVLLNLNRQENKKKTAYNLLEFLGIDKKKANRRITQLSGGEQQRVAIARALANESKIILADEPTGNLDEKTEKEIIEIFKELAHKYNKCVIVVTHSNEFVKHSDNVFKLEEKKLKIL